MCSLVMGGSNIRPESTGYGTVYFGEEILKEKGENFKVCKAWILNLLRLQLCSCSQRLGRSTGLLLHLVSPAVSAACVRRADCSQAVLRQHAAVTGQEGGRLGLGQRVDVRNREAAGPGGHPCDCL